MLITTKTIVAFKMPEEYDKCQRFCETDAWKEDWAETVTPGFVTYSKSATYQVEDMEW